jgi:hypothetical protein
MSQGVLVPVKKADIPEALLAHVKKDLAGGWVKSTWTEIVGWGSCKLVARKQGAVTRFAHSHYGYYECCRKAEVESLGYATEGTSYDTLPMWALTIWIMAKTKAKKSIAEGYRLTQTRIRLDRWTRHAMNQFTVYFTELESGMEWKVVLYRGDTAPFIRFYSRHLATEREWSSDNVHGELLAA